MKPAPPSDLPKTTRFITKNCGASQIPNSGLLLPSLRATWQEEESCSSTSSSRGPQYPGFLASQSQQPACCPPPREMGPRDSSQGQEKTWRTDGEQGGGRCQLTHPLPQASPGDDLRALNNLFQIQAAPPPLLQAQGGKRTRGSPAPGRAQPKFPARGPGSHFPNHRSDSSSPQGYERPWSERAGQGRGHHYHIRSSCSSAPCLSLSSSLWLTGKGRDGSTRPGAAAQVPQNEDREWRIRKELSLLGYKGKERRWDETPWPFLRAIRAWL